MSLYMVNEQLSPAIFGRVIFIKNVFIFIIFYYTLRQLKN